MDLPHRVGGRLKKLARMPMVFLLNAIEPPVLVLAYHRVTRLEGDAIGMAVSPENFRAQLRHMRDHYPVLRFEDDWGRVKRPSLVITFDDGYADNLETALPILEEFKMPGAFFISSGWIGSPEEFWWDELENLFLGPHSLPARLSLDTGTGLKEWDTSTPQARARAYRGIHPAMKRAPTPARDALLARLRDWSGLGHHPRASHRSLRLDELKALAASPLVTIGAHTISHPMLSSRSREDQKREIVESRRTLEGMIGKPIDVFSFPFGDYPDYNEDTLSVCREAGFKKTAAAHAGQARRGTDPMRIPRVFIHNWNESQFASKLRLFFNS